MLRVSFFLWVVMFNLTIFWVRENSSFLFLEFSTTSCSMIDPFCLPGTALVPFVHTSMC